MIQRVPDDKVTVIVLCNVDNISAGNIARDVIGDPLRSPVPGSRPTPRSSRYQSTTDPSSSS